MPDATSDCATVGAVSRREIRLAQPYRAALRIVHQIKSMMCELRRKVRNIVTQKAMMIVMVTMVMTIAIVMGVMTISLRTDIVKEQAYRIILLQYSNYSILVACTMALS